MSISMQQITNMEQITRPLYQQKTTSTGPFAEYKFLETCLKRYTDSRISLANIEHNVTGRKAYLQ